MNHNRRKFLHTAGAMAAGGLLLPTWACKGTEDAGQGEAANRMEAPTPTGTLRDFGIQLYTLRDDMPQDPKGVIAKLASYGYTQLEGYEGPQGMFWGMRPAEFKTYLDGQGLSMVASHCNINADFETKAAQAAEVGMDYLVCPYVGPQESLDDFKRIADQFNACGKICAQNGIRFAYHNHAYSFEALEGQLPQDYLMAHTDPATVDYELDLYWVVTGQADPIAYLEKYPNRFRLCHVKDRLKSAAADEHDASCDLGTGSIDYAKILQAAQANGMQYYIVEQERYDNSTPLKSAEVDAAYMKSLVFG